MNAVVALALPGTIAVAVFLACAPHARGLRLAVVVLRRRTVGLTAASAGAALLTRASLSLRRLRSARAHRTEGERVADDLPDVVDLLAVAASAGCNVRLGLEAVVRAHDGPAAAVLHRAINDVETGERVADALSALLRSAPRPVADALRPLASVLVDADRYGSALDPALARLSTDVRVHRQRRAEERARRVPVRLLLPLVLCVLPAFALLTVAPLLAGIARDALAPSMSVPPEPENLP